MNFKALSSGLGITPGRIYSGTFVYLPEDTGNFSKRKAGVYLVLWNDHQQWNEYYPATFQPV